METLNADRPAGGAKGAVAVRRLPGLRVMTLAVTLATIAAAATRPVMDPDLWWHLATGRYIWTLGHVPAVEVFSFTAAGRPWITHEWLSELLLYGGWQLVGPVGLALLFSLVIAGAFGLVYLRCHSRPVPAAASVLVAALASSASWGVRPQMFTLLFASLFLYILDRWMGTQPRRLWLLVPVALLWANLHPGYLMGLALIGVYALGEQWSWLRQRGGQGAWLAPAALRLALVGAVSWVATLVTPNGLASAWAALFILGNKLHQANIQEWLSPNFHESWAWPLLAYWLILLATLAVSRRRANATQVLLLVGTGAAALFSARHIPFLSLVGAPILAEHLEGLWVRGDTGERVRRESPLLRKGLAVVLALLVVLVGVNAARVHQRHAEVEREIYPGAAVAYLTEHGLVGPIFNTYHWGGYLVWRGFKPFIDGRAEVYGDEILGDYLTVHGVKPAWEQQLRRYGVEVVLTETDSPLAVLLSASGQWRAVYHDDLATILVPASDASPDL